MKSQGFLQTPQEIIEEYNGCSVPQYTGYPSMRCQLEGFWMGLDGFVPSYNLQVAVNVLTVEALKQGIA